MNKYLIRKVFLVIFLSAVFLNPINIYASEQQGPVFKGGEKLGLGLKQVWSKAMETGDMLAEIPCIVRLQEGLTLKKAEIRRQLGGAGFKAKTVLKTIVTGKIAVGDLPRLAALDMVRSVELGRPVGIKRGN